MTVQTRLFCPKCGDSGLDGQPAAIDHAALSAESAALRCENCDESGLAEDRNHQVKHPCPHCGDTEARLMPPLGYYSEYACPRCGVYRVSGTMERLIELGTVDPKAARIRLTGGNRCLVEEIVSGLKIPRWGRDKIL